MALYKYKVADNTGKTSETLVEADSQKDAARRLQQRGLRPITYMGEGAVSSETQPRGMFSKKFDVTDFTDRMVPLMEAGIPLEKALGILADSHENEASRTVISDLRRGLHEGRSLSQMLRDRSSIFPELYASLIEVGEESGAMAEIMADLRDFLNSRREMASYILSASIYPLIVFGISLLVLGILLGVIVPRFANVLSSAGVEISGALHFMIGISDFLRSYWWALTIGVVVFVLWLKHAGKQEWFKESKDKLFLRIPLIKTMVLYANLARFTRTMAIMLRNGSHILQTVSISTRVIQSNVLRRSISDVSTGLRRGQNLSDLLGQSPYVPAIFLRMLSVGEETGDMATMLERISDRLEKDLKQLVTRCLSFIEPAVIVVLGLVVGLIVITMFMAIMDMQGGI